MYLYPHKASSDFRLRRLLGSACNVIQDNDYVATVPGTRNEKESASHALSARQALSSRAQDISIRPPTIPTRRREALGLSSTSC